jgi:hypothetical protein
MHEYLRETGYRKGKIGRGERGMIKEVGRKGRRNDRRKKGGMAKGRGSRREQGQEEEKRYGKRERK